MTAKDLEPLVCADMVYAAERKEAALKALREAVLKEEPRHLLDELPMLYAELCMAVKCEDVAIAQQEILQQIGE